MLYFTPQPAQLSCAQTISNIINTTDRWSEQHWNWNCRRNVTKSFKCWRGLKVPQIHIWLSVHGTCWKNYGPWRPQLVTHRIQTICNQQSTARHPRITRTHPRGPVTESWQLKTTCAARKDLHAEQCYSLQLSAVLMLWLISVYCIMPSSGSVVCYVCFVSSKMQMSLLGHLVVFANKCNFLCWFIQPFQPQLMYLFIPAVFCCKAL